MASLGGFAGLIKHLKMKTRKALKDMQAQRVIVSIRTADNYLYIQLQWLDEFARAAHKYSTIH